MEKNQDAEVRVFFVKILNSISWFLLWVISFATAGIYFQLGFKDTRPLIIVILFYAIMLITLLLLIRYLIRTWKDSKS